VAAIARRRGVAPADIEVWFADEARIGQKNKITRRWARRGSRPAAPSDQRYASTYIFGAICPRDGKAVGLVLPRCNIAAMNLHLAAISADVAPGRLAAVLLDQAGWHLSKRLAVPDNISLVPLPAKCPELNAQENVWQFMLDTWTPPKTGCCLRVEGDRRSAVARSTCLWAGWPRVLLVAARRQWFVPRVRRATPARCAY